MRGACRVVCAWYALCRGQNEDSRKRCRTARGASPPGAIRRAPSAARGAAAGEQAAYGGGGEDEHSSPPPRCVVSTGPALERRPDTSGGYAPVESGVRYPKAGQTAAGQARPTRERKRTAPGGAPGLEERGGPGARRSLPGERDERPGEGDPCARGPVEDTGRQNAGGSPQRESKPLCRPVSGCGGRVGPRGPVGARAAEKRFGPLRKDDKTGPEEKEGCKSCGVYLRAGRRCPSVGLEPPEGKPLRAAPGADQLRKGAASGRDAESRGEPGGRDPRGKGP